MTFISKTMTTSDQAKRVTLIGALVNLFLAITKLVIGTISHSHALVADGIHSLSDLITDALVMVTSHYGRQAADAEHPYGHQRIETLGTILLAIVLIIVAIGIMYEGIIHLFTVHQLVLPGVTALIVAVFSVLANEWLYRITKQVGERIHSALLTANAWHHRSDAASSLVVVVGLAGTYLGWWFLDIVASIVVALFILRMGLQLVWSGLRELIDTSVEAETVDEINRLIANIPGVVECHELRTRLMGGKIMVDVHVIVRPKISVSEGHRIGEEVENALFTNIDHMHDVVVHIDPEDDEHCAPCQHLPLRSDIHQQVSALLLGTPAATHLDKMVLHYLSGKMDIELFADIADFNTKEAMQLCANETAEKCRAISSIDHVQLTFTALS